jgi:hypothetical protein
VPVIFCMIRSRGDVASEHWAGAEIKTGP